MLMFFAGLLVGFALYGALDWGVRALFRALDRSERDYHGDQVQGGMR